MMEHNKNEKVVDVAADGDLYQVETTGEPRVGQVGNADELQRHLGNRQLQLIAIGKFHQRATTHRIQTVYLHTDMSQVDPSAQRPLSPSPMV